MNTTNNKISNFLKNSMALIDDQDIKRELNDVQLKYASDLLQKEMELQNLESNINKININTEKLVLDSEKYKENFKSVKDQLN